MKRKFRRIGAALLAVALLLSAMGIAEAARPLGISLNELVKRAQQGAARGADNVLMEDGYETFEEFVSGSGKVLGSDISRDVIGSVRFEDSLSGRGENAWDVSAAGDGSVLAWVELEGGLYALTIAGEGGVKLSPDSGQLFANYVNMRSFDLNGCVDASELDNLFGMFYNCAALEELDLSEFESSKGTDFSYMFALCTSLQRLDITKLDTRNAESLAYMFYMVCNMQEFAGSLWCPDDALYDHIYACSTLLDNDAQLMHDSPSEDELASLSDYMAGRDVVPEALGYALGSDIPRARVRSIRFVDGLADAPEDAWDVSASGTGMVLAWAEPNGDLYDLTLGSLHELALGYDMKNQFANYVNLEEFTLEGGIDASHTFEFDGMFSGCRKLTELDLSKFETFNAETLPRMFEGCESLRRLDLSNFDVRYAANLDSMFAGTAALEEIVTGENFLIDESASCEGIFDGSGYIDNAPTEGGVDDADDADDADEGISIMDALGGSNRASTEMSVLRADSLEGAALNTGEGRVLGSDLPRAAVRSIRFVSDKNGAPEDAWDVSQAGDDSVLAWAEPSGDMYDLTIAANGKIALSDGNTLFGAYTSLEELDFNGCVDTSAVADMSGMFYSCYSLTSLDLSGFDTASVTDMYKTFYDCHSLTSLDLSGFNTANVTDMNSMFCFCNSLTSLDVSGFDTSNVIDMIAMFWECESLESLDVSGFNTANVIRMNYMFSNCASLASLDVSGFDTANVINMASMFYDCKSLKSLDVSGFKTAKVTDMSFMFWNCESLGSLDLSGFDTANVTDMSSMFSSCSGLTSLDLSNFDTHNVTDMSGMFSGCSNLAELNLLNFDTRNVTDMSGMFRETKSLPDVKVGENFIIGNDVKRDEIFEGSMMLS